MKRLKYPVYVFLIVFLFFCLLEIIALVFCRHSFPFTTLIKKDPRRGYRLKPHAKVELEASGTIRNYFKYWKDTGYLAEISIDGQGFRGKGDYSSKDADLKVICFGDSITFGLDVPDDQTYSYYLEGLLAAEFPGKRVRVINAGIFGYTSRQGLVYAEELIKKEKPFAASFGFGINDTKTPLRRSWCALPGVNDHDIMKGDIKGGFEKIKLEPLQKMEESLLGSYSFQMALYAFDSIIDPIRMVRLGILGKRMERQQQKQPSPGQDFLKKVRVPPRHHQSNLLDFIKLARSYGAYPILLKQKEVPSEYKEGFYQVVSWENDVGVVDLDQLFGTITIDEIRAKAEYNQRLGFYEELLGKQVIAENPDLWFTTDGVHPNSLGNYIIAERMFEIILRRTGK